MIEFSCPSCRALIRVADGAGGKKGTCPQCKTRLTVPHESEAPELAPPPENKPAPPVEFHPAHSTPADDTDWQQVTQGSVPTTPEDSTAPIIEIKTKDKPVTSGRRTRRRKSSGGGWIVPLACGLVLVGFVGGYFWMTHSGLSPDVTGDVVADPDIPDGLIAHGDVSVDRKLFEKVRKSLQTDSLKLVSSTHLADVTLSGNISGIVSSVKPSPGAMCVKVSLDGTDVEDYVADHAKELNEYRMSRIKETADTFITEWAAAIDSGDKEIPHLNQVRDHMALASVLSGFGYHVVAWDGSTVSPCVGVDNSGNLFFFLKPNTKTFIIRGRDLNGDTPGFPGEIVVRVKAPKQSTTKTPASSKTPEPEKETDEEPAEIPEEETETESENETPEPATTEPE